MQRLPPGQKPARALLFLLAALTLALRGAARADPWVVISEIHYAPPEGERLEFVEVYLPDAPRADLGGWTLEGAVRFRFPRGAALSPGERAVVAADPAAVKQRAPGARVLGPFEGRLDDRGGRLALRSAAGSTVFEVVYKDRGGWPAAAGGAGHTLSLLDPILDPSRPESWAPSPAPGGTPGAENGFARAEPPAGAPIVRAGEAWRFFRGRREPPAEWREPSLDDSRWEVGPAPLGYGQEAVRTRLDDMEGNYLALYARHSFTLEEPARCSRLLLRVDYDDGFIASLNGVEVARANLGFRGIEITPEIPAFGAREAGAPAEFDLSGLSRRLRAGKNVLAIEVHNNRLDSSDLVLDAELECVEAAPARRDPARALLNEVQIDRPEAPGFVELFNPGAAPAALEGHFLSDDPRDLRKFPLPAGTRLPARGFLALTRKELGEGFRLAGPELLVALVRPDGRTVADALRFGGLKPGPAGASVLPRGRFPDGARATRALHPPTPGARNRLEPGVAVVVNEIHYHPLSEDPAEEFIELLSRGKERVELEGFRLRGGASYRFRAGEAIDPGALLVVARDPGALARKRGLDPARVVGPFEGKLADAGETLVLEDPRGLDVDRVEYADRHPWPREADGSGSSLELIDPALDNELPGAWAASDERPRSSWEALRHEKEYLPAGNRTAPELHLLLLGAGECLVDDLEVREGDRTLFREDFEGGPGRLSAQGTHESSAIVDDGTGGRCLRVEATAGGTTHHNLVLLRGLDGLERGSRYEVRLRARWQRGSPLLLVRAAGNALARLHRLSMPVAAGTPGAPNSVRTPSPAPLVGTPLQEPVAPAEADPVRIAVRIAAAGAVARAELRYRSDGESEWRTSPLNDHGEGADLLAGDGVHGGEIPPLPAGIVEFHIACEDAEGRRGWFPREAPGRSALYAVGLRAPAELPAYTLLVTARDWGAMIRAPRLSNRLTDATFVYGDSRIFYNVGFRARGSPWTRRKSNNWKLTFGAETLDGRRSLMLDRQYGNAHPNERIVYWLIDALRAPSLRSRYVHFSIPGREDGICEDVEEVDRRFLRRWFGGERGGEGGALGPAGGAGPLFKVNDYIELSDEGFRGNMRLRQRAALEVRSDDPEDYRWNFYPRGSGSRDDLTPIIKLAELFDPEATPDEEFLRRVEAEADLDEWIRVFAARAAAGDWDTLGRHGGKNAFLFQPESTRRWLLLPWDCDQTGLRHPPTDPIVSREHPAFARFLGLPRYRRAYLGALAFLAGRKLEPGALDAALGDLERRAGVRGEELREFLLARREYLLEEIPEITFRVIEDVRVPRQGKPDLLRVRAEGPVLIQCLRLGGEEVPCRAESLAGFAAELSIGPEGGEREIEFLDLGGNEVARARAAVPPRVGAAALPH